jgi:ABC-type multidrug transport system ATPase subunit
MDEANLCDRIALIQNGRIFSIDTPANIVNRFPKKLYRVESENNYLLLNELRKNPNVQSAFMFGDNLHVTFNGELKVESGKLKIENSIEEELNFQLSTFNFQLTEIQPSVEDCFIAFNL